ncbi:MAG: replication protein A [ANME-2 cluster archaeon]|nr:replication protein A [ANME-2 cluster archaeon]
MDEKIAPHVDEIIRALGTTNTTVNHAIIKEELTRLIEFKVPPEEAKRSLLKKYGVSEVKKLTDLHGGERDIEITARILDINLKVVGIKGQERTIFMGTMADETGAKSFTAWEDFGLEIGDVVKVNNAYIRLWQGMPEINFGPRSEVEKINSGVLDSLTASDMDKPVPLAELMEGAAAVHTIFRVMEYHQQEINTKNGSRTILTGIAADSTAKLPFTSWEPNPEITDGATVEVKNAYIKSWRGIPTINMGEFTAIARSETDISEDDLAPILDTAPVRLDSISGRMGVFDAVIEGSLISIRPGSGLIIRCPQCSRVIQKSTCRVHGVVEGLYDMRIKSILDDGTGALTVVLDADLTQKVTGYSIEKAKEVAALAMDQTSVEDEMRRRLLGRTMRARGNMTKGEYGTTLVAAEAELTEMDTAAAAIALIEEMGAVPQVFSGEGESP